LVYEKGDPAELQIMYNDATRGKAFPVRVLWFPDSGLVWKGEHALNVGTLTLRHVDYDHHVDVYLVRDRETRNLTNVEIEALAYDRMSEILSDPMLASESYLAIYQTGLEPLVVGMYRAIVEHLQYRRREGLGQLCVQPVFYVAGRHRARGTLWG
jgi:hypothetical protein